MIKYSRTTAVLVAVFALVCGLLLGAVPAQAAARVTVQNSDGEAVADPKYATTVTVQASGFQSISKGFGGVYVLFGWVDNSSSGSWRPSKGGAVGTNYRYVPDSEDKNNKGYMRFISFPGSETEDAAHAVMSKSGNWKVSMVIPGSTFQSRDRRGKTTSIDCLKVTCGIITIGAHGVKNGNNETFTPIRFQNMSSSSGNTNSNQTSDPEGAGTSETTPGELRVGVSNATVQAGSAIVFTGQGFEVGEQVVAAFDDGFTAVGPLTAGLAGEVAGALPVPRDARNGTHLISLTGAATGAVAQTEVVVEGSSLSAAPPIDGDSVPQWIVVLLVIAIVLAFILIAASIITAISRWRARHRNDTLRAAPTSGSRTRAGNSGRDIYADATPTEPLPSYRNDR